MKKEDEITLDVATAKGIFTGIFAKTAKIAEVIAAIIKEMGLDGGVLFDLVNDGEVLEPDSRTLVSFGFSGTVKLELVSTGSGV